MRITTRMFVSSMTFGAVVAAIYGLTTRELVGVFLLGIFTLGFAWVSAYLIVSRRSTPLDGDGTLAPADLAGERIGIFTVESPWPVVLALASAGLLIGVFLHPALAVVAIGVLLWVVWMMVREST